MTLHRCEQQLRMTEGLPEGGRAMQGWLVVVQETKDPRVAATMGWNSLVIKRSDGLVTPCAHTLLNLFQRDIFLVCGDVPDVTKGINHTAAAITIELIH